MDRDLVRERLLAEKERLEAARERQRERAASNLKEMTDELSLYDQHPGDIGSEVFEREKDLGLMELLDEELEKVEEALRQLKEGRYGFCLSCGRPIDERRLEVLPWATLCKECAELNVDRYQRPVEERVLDMHEIDAKGDWFEVGGFDLFEEFGLDSSGHND